MHFDKYMYLIKVIMNFKSAVVYWIHLPEHSDYTSDGYLGVTTDFGVRMNGHLTNIQKNKHKNPHLVDAVQKYGWDNLVKEIILSGDEAYCYEIEEQIRPKKTIGWNIAPGGHRGPGWTKGTKKRKESIEKQKISMVPINDEKKKIRLKKREDRLLAREVKRKEKQKILDEKKLVRQQRVIKKQATLTVQLAEREKRIQKKIKDGNYGVPLNRTDRPFCPMCNKNVCAVNCIKNGKRYYRKTCDVCSRLRLKMPTRKPNWFKSGYKKKLTCDLCGFRSLFATQIAVFHLDGNLENIAFDNLRSICLNCVEMVKKKEVTWKRGDLQVDWPSNKPK